METRCTSLGVVIKRESTIRIILIWQSIGTDFTPMAVITAP